MTWMLFTLSLIIGSEMKIFDFGPDSDIENWYIVNDGVMGGLSEGSLILNEEGNGVFEGEVSLENNGGFTSVRYSFEQREVTGAKKALIRLKGDGKRYQFRVKPNWNDSHSYIQYFETTGEWETIEIPLNEMYASWRGRTLDLPNYDATYLSDICFLIANYKAESFRLEIDYVLLQ